jgi:hypothetical protein
MQYRDWDTESVFWGSEDSEDADGNAGERRDSLEVEGNSPGDQLSLRIEKVMEIRRAIRTGHYDTECRMEELLEAFENALSAVCRGGVRRIGEAGQSI